jgi:hypothetical protein
MNGDSGCASTGAKFRLTEAMGLSFMEEEFKRGNDDGQ